MGTGIPADPDAAINGHSDPVSIAYEAAIVYARNLGAEHGRNAASWYTDGNTTAQTARWILRGIEDGDPEVLDTFPTADLSGEWADGLTGPQLVDDACAAAGENAHGEDDHDCLWFGDICDAYEAAFSQAASDTIASAARAILAD